MSTTQDYQAAELLLRRARPGEPVVGDKIKPQWIDGSTRFWARHSWAEQGLP